MEAFFGELNFRTFYRLFDIIFVLSALIGMAIIWLNDRLKNENYSKYIEGQNSEHLKTE